MLPLSLVREILLAVLVVLIGVFIVGNLVKPSTASIDDILEGSYKYKYNVELPDQSLKIIECEEGKISKSNTLEITIRFEPDSFENLTRTHTDRGRSEEEHIGVRIETEGMADSYKFIYRDCEKKEDEHSYKCDFHLEDIPAPKRFCEDSGSEEVPLYVSLWDHDLCDIYKDEMVPLTVVYQTCIEPGALKGFMKAEQPLEVEW